MVETIEEAKSKMPELEQLTSSSAAPLDEPTQSSNFCSVCGRSFANAKALANHSRTHQATSRREAKTAKELETRASEAVKSIVDTVTMVIHLTGVMIKPISKLHYVGAYMVGSSKSISDNPGTAEACAKLAKKLSQDGVEAVEKVEKVAKSIDVLTVMVGVAKIFIDAHTAGTAEIAKTKDRDKKQREYLAAQSTPVETVREGKVVNIREEDGSIPTLDLSGF